MGATSLGIATAYGYAKSKGYTGTEEEFTQLMYDLTIDVPAAEAAIASANSAAAKIDNMTVAAQAATGSNPSAVISEVSGHKHILFKLVKGDHGDTGEGVPSGGTTGQVLKKASGTDYDTEWANDAGGVQIDDTAGVGDTGVTWSANKSATELSSKYEKPSGGIPDTDLSSAVQTSLGLADSAYQKPSGGIPATDIASGVIPDISGKADKTDTVLLTTLSLGRKDNTTVGTNSTALGISVEASGAYSHAEGGGTKASGDNSHAEGGGTTSSGGNSHSEGGGTTASGVASHAEGSGTVASGAQAHAEGGSTTASAENAHAEGGGTTASQPRAHAEGSTTNASGQNAHAEGNSTTASGQQTHAEGLQTTASADNSHAEGNLTRAAGYQSHAEGMYTYASGTQSHAEGYGYSSTATNYGALGKADHSEGYRTKANSGSTSSYYGAHAEGYYTEATSRAAHAEGYYTKASETDSHAEGYYSKASSAAAHAEGNNTRAAGNATHAEGQYTYAKGSYSHAEGWGYSDSSTDYGALGTADHSEGYRTKANSGYSYAAHAEGQNTSATAGGAHAEGVGSSASGSSSHAEGQNTYASGSYSHAEGYYTTASGQQSHAEGYYSKATGPSCHAEGHGTEANSSQLVGGQHVFGTYNFPIVSKTITITAGGGETWEQNKAYKAYSCYFEVTDGGVTTYYVPHLNVPAYIDPTLDYAQGFWHTYTLPSGTSMSSIPEWDKDTLYPQNSTVKVLLYDGTYQAFQNHVAITTTYVPFTSSTYYHTQSVGTSFGQFQNILEIVGNGSTSYSWSKSNARTLDTDGNERLMGDLYVHCDKYSEGGTKVATISEVIPKPVSASAGDFLCFNGTDWVATTLATWQGGSY